MKRDTISDAATGATGAPVTGGAHTNEPDGDGAELLEDRSRRITGGAVGRRVKVSVPAAIAGTFLVAALAFGAAIGPLGTDGPSSIGAGGKDTGAANGETADKPGEVAPPDQGSPDGAGSEPAQTDELAQTDEPTPTDAPRPETTEIDLALALDGSRVAIEWSACETDGFIAYKIIRSTDEFATWPLGAGDALAGVATDATVARFVDGAVTGGRTYHYRVIALRSFEGETIVACSSETARITTPAPPVPPTADVALTVVIKEGHPFLDWSECAGVDFDYFKVVRSTDATVTWPKGDNDSLVAAIGRDGNSFVWDGDAPGGVKVYYRVFCVRSTEGGYVAQAASAVKSIVTPVAEPAPDPVALGFEVGVNGDGVGLIWQACTSDGFAFYEVVRSTWNEHPSYLPYTDGTEVIGVIENQATIELTDTSVASGQTIYYRVQAIGYWNGVKVLLGQTAVLAVTIP